MNDKQKLESVLVQLVDLRLGITESIVIDKGEFGTLLEDALHLKIAEYDLLEEQKEHDTQISDMMRDSEIIHSYNEGAKVPELANEFELSEDHTQDIIDKYESVREGKMQSDLEDQQESTGL